MAQPGTITGEWHSHCLPKTMILTTRGLPTRLKLSGWNPGESVALNPSWQRTSRPDEHFANQ